VALWKADRNWAQAVQNQEQAPVPLRTLSRFPLLGMQPLGTGLAPLGTWDYYEQTGCKLIFYFQTISFEMCTWAS
jgi:hypothetical protein